MNPYGVDVREDNIIGPLARLKILYDEMPATSGCEKCREKNGENAFWCCLSQSPSMYYIEFLYVWREVQKWSKTNRANLVLRCIRNYLSNSLSKGCVMHEGKCLCYSQRPYMCKLYGVIHKTSWDKRWTDLRERQKDKFEAKDQCPLVIIDQEGYEGKEGIKPEDEDNWFKQISRCEERIGVQPRELSLHDQSGGSYRTFHDHILIELFEPAFLERLTKVRFSNPTAEDVDKTIEIVDGVLQEYGIIK